MPRLNSSTYLTRHDQLKQLWDEDPRQFSYLSPAGQLDLHKFFLFALEKTNEELLAHRHNVNIGDQSLAHRAGKAYARFMLSEQTPIKHLVHTADGRRIYLRTLMRPEPDVKLLVAAFRMLAQQENRAKEKDRSEAA